MPKETFLNLEEMKKDKIEDILLDIFSNQNIANISVAQIVNEMQMSRGAFYKYFGDLADAYQYITQKGMMMIHDEIFFEIINHDNNLFEGIKAFVVKFSKLNKDDLLYRYFILLKNVSSDNVVIMPKAVNVQTWSIILDKTKIEFKDNDEKISYLIFIMTNLINILKFSIKRNWDEAELIKQYNYFLSWLK